MIININELKDYILHNSTFAKEETIDIVLHDLMEALISNNFDLNNLRVESGETSINFIGDDIVIRLTYVRYNNWGYPTLSDYVSHSTAILQPLFEQKINTGDINYPTILGLKKLSVGNVSETEKEVTYIRLREDGYLFNDANKVENYGKDENGEVYLIDFGELIYIKDSKKITDSELFNRIQYQKFVERELEYHKNACPEFNEKYDEFREFLIQFQVDLLRESYNDGSKSK